MPSTVITNTLHRPKIYSCISSPTGARLLAIASDNLHGVIRIKPNTTNTGKSKNTLDRIL